MGRWAQARKRGRGANPSAALPVPVLVDNGIGILSWSVAGVVPVSAAVWLDDGTGYVLLSTQAWVSTFDGSVQPGSYKVQGLDGGGGAVTAFSNIVVIA